MTQINGLKLIHDFKDTSLHYLMHCTPPNLYLLKHSALDCLPGRFKEIHIINESIVFKAAWSFFLSDPEELFDYFPRSVLPPEYGGHLEDTSTDGWIRKANKWHEQDTAAGQCNFY
ncbi:alpha-tocopherol transfer protein-like [Caerostris extrusa]|uniref:Alpha-tocopherol transfer protein-like n=1 Tax=Caerostris extrusa TaxID=172846 RepID=A0AAV4T8Q1_CAEEX|nr:alpha-tocopherol transfer protein-like [Caerostris extrusa]